MNAARLVPAISAAIDCDSSPRDYQRSAAATRISLTSSSATSERSGRNIKRNGRHHVTSVIDGNEPLSCSRRVCSEEAFGRNRRYPFRKSRAKIVRPRVVQCCRRSSSRRSPRRRLSRGSCSAQRESRRRPTPSRQRWVSRTPCLRPQFRGFEHRFGRDRGVELTSNS
jgi:hypothetical protein